MPLLGAISPVRSCTTGAECHAAKTRMEIGKVLAVSESQPTRLDLAIQRRAEELGITLNELATQAGIDRETLRNLRNRTRRPRYRTRAEKAIEPVLGWELGSVRNIEEGGEPELRSADAVESTLETKNPFEGVPDLEEAIRNRTDLSDEGKRIMIDYYRAYRSNP